MEKKKLELKNLIAMLNVSDIDQSLDFYQKALGFELVSQPEALKEWRWGIIRSGKTELMLSETQCELKLKPGINPRTDVEWPVIFYFYPEDVEALYKDVCGKGFAATPLEDTIYGMREFSLQDPDGHLLSFGQDLN